MGAFAPFSFEYYYQKGGTYMSNKLATLLIEGFVELNTKVNDRKLSLKLIKEENQKHYYLVYASAESGDHLKVSEAIMLQLIREDS